MTIEYQNGTVLEAALLSHRGDELRAAIAGDQDVRTFTRTNGVWISEDLEPVTIQFEWQRRRTENVPTEADCICSKQDAARLISMLFSGSGHETSAAPDGFYVLSAEGERVHIQTSQLNIQ